MNTRIASIALSLATASSPALAGMVYWNMDTASCTSNSFGYGAGSITVGSLAEGNNNGTTTMLGNTSASSTYTFDLNGTTTSASVTLGKRLSRDFYVAYERSLAGTLGTLFIFFDPSRRLTLRAQTGEQSAVDLIFTQIGRAHV